MAADGRPSQAIGNGQTYVYDFEVRNRASMNFYHPHTHEATATQLYRGLAGLIIVEDEEERALEYLLALMKFFSRFKIVFLTRIINSYIALICISLCLVFMAIKFSLMDRDSII